jgi:hypothetical protein
MLLVDKSAFPGKKRFVFVLGDAGGEEFPLNADAGTTRLPEDCFHIVNGDRDAFLSCSRMEAAVDADIELVLPFSTITKPLLLLSSE